MLNSFNVCSNCRGRIVTKVVSTCDQTPSLIKFGNKICLNKTVYFKIIPEFPDYAGMHYYMKTSL